MTAEQIQFRANFVPRKFGTSCGANYIPLHDLSISRRFCPKSSLPESRAKCRDVYCPNPPDNIWRRPGRRTPIISSEKERERGDAWPLSLSEWEKYFAIKSDPMAICLLCQFNRITSSEGGGKGSKEGAKFFPWHCRQARRIES